MSLKNTKRRYGHSDASIKQLSDKLLIAARRDLPKLVHYGETEESLDALEAAIAAFALCPPDEYYAGAMMHATFVKNETRKMVLQHTRQIRERAALYYAGNNAMLVEFGTATLSRQTDNELVRSGKAIARAATRNASDLATMGFTPAMLADYTALIARFDTEIDAQIDKVLKRDVAVENRIALGNKLYAMMLSLAAKGKLCWQDESAAYHNDYILTNHQHKDKQIIEGNIAPETVVNASMHDAKPKTKIRVYNRGNVPLNFYFAAGAADMPKTQSITLAAGAHIAETAAYFGFAEEAQRFNVYNSSPAEGSYELVW
jgi:hypothetical protein